MRKKNIVLICFLAAALSLGGCKKIETPQTEAAASADSSDNADAAETTAAAQTEAAAEEAAPSDAAAETEAVSADTSAETEDSETADGTESETETETGSLSAGGLSANASIDDITETEDASSAVEAESASGETAENGPAKELTGEVIVYNWGEYLDPEVLVLFEEETGVKVIYEEFETNEIMYPKVAAGAISYDVVCPSDYMIDRMIKEDLLAPLNFDNIPNYKNIDEQYINASREFDPENRYSVPYCWGTVGILYNKTMVDEPIDSWSVLWDEKYKDNILMQDSVRDALMIPLRMLGYSMNTTDEDELNEATEMLIEQKPLVQAYVIDQVRDKMIGDEAAIGVIYSGEAIYTQRENENLEYVIPKEGTNVWIDSWVIPKNAGNKENAEAFINFLCRPDIALMNFDYITYSTPNKVARDLIEDEEIRNSPIAYPDASVLENCETYRYLGEDADVLYTNCWNRVKSS